MKKILVLGCTNINKDPRILRQIAALKANYHLTVAGIMYEVSDEQRFIQLDFNKGIFEKLFAGALSLFGFHYLRFWNKRNTSNLYRISDEKYDLILANDIETLPLACKLKEVHGSKIIFDAHELYSHMHKDFVWVLYAKSFYHYISKRYLPLIDNFVTVSEGILKQYQIIYNVQSGLIIHNSPRYFKIEPNQVDVNSIKLIHHGFAMPDRKIELLIEMMNYLSAEYELHLMLAGGSKKYINFLKTKALPLGKKVIFNDPVKISEIIPTINKFDIGVYIFPTDTLNNKYALPNKFFDFIQARLALVVAPSPEMGNIIRKYSTGVVSPDFTAQSLAKTIKGLSFSDIMKYKNNSSQASKVLNSDNSYEAINNIIIQTLL